jgi:hypothetical protein
MVMATRAVFCVQCYAGLDGPLVKGRLWQFGAEDEARQAGELLKGRVAGFVMFKVEGEPDFGFWDEPVVLDTYGRVPDELTAAAA